jgi:protein CWC15
LQKEQQERELEQKTREILSSNPLLAKGEGDFTIKKKYGYHLKSKQIEREQNIFCNIIFCRWYEDTVFKNQARVEERQSKKRFINDTTRNDFHIKFLRKYVK